MTLTTRTSITIIDDVPVGGTTGQVLTKASNADYDLVWSAGSGGGATIPSVTNLIKGDGAGNGADSGIAAANVALLNTSNTFTGALAASNLSGTNTGDQVVPPPGGSSGDFQTNNGIGGFGGATINATNSAAYVSGGTLNTIYQANYFGPFSGNVTLGNPMSLYNYFSPTTSGLQINLPIVNNSTASIPLGSTVSFINLSTSNSYAVYAHDATTLLGIVPPSGTIYLRLDDDFSSSNGVWKQTGIDMPRLLNTVTGINAKTIANTSLYIVPTGKIAIVTEAIVRCTAANSVSAGPTLSIGRNASSYNDIYASATLTALTSSGSGAGSAFAFGSIGIFAQAAATDVINLAITLGATATSQTIAVDLIGYLI